MHKKILGVLIVLGSCITCITQAYNYTYQIPEHYVQIIDNERTIGPIAGAPTDRQNYSWTIENNGNTTTSYDGNTNLGIFLPINNPYGSIAHSISVFWNNNKLYYYTNNDGQGYYNYFCTGNINNYVNKNNNDFIKCLSASMGGEINEQNYTQRLTSIEEFNNNGIYHNNIVGILYVDSNAQGNYSNRPTDFGFIYNDNSFVIFPSLSSSNFVTLTGTLGINYTQPMTYGNFASLDNLKQEAPIVNGGGNGYTQLPMCYTIQQKIDSFPSNYNIEMCYSSNKIWSGNQFVTVTPKSMLELRPTYQEYVEDVNLYQNYCGNYVANQTACGEAFSGKEEERSIINKLYNQGTTTILRSYDYCYLQLNFTEEQKRTRTNCTMTGNLQHGSGITTDDIIEDMQNHQIVIITPDGNTVYSGFWNNESGDNEANLSYDGIVNSMQSVRGKLTNIFYYRTGVTGIIPDYITRILLLIVLFAIFKK